MVISMDYLTANETAKEWNISSRMVAYYCENGRIKDAVKKGKTWFIPIGAKKPTDKRRSAKKAGAFCEGEPYSSPENGIDKQYRTGDVSNHLGLTRETLRYYEDIGLITPKRDKFSQYRAFDLYDMSHLMAIDFFKKRGFTSAEIKDLLNAVSTAEYTAMIEGKIALLHQELASLNEMLGQLEETKNFYDYAVNNALKFTVREFPPYYVEEVIGSITFFEEYREKALRYLHLENEDILSSMVRAITFDENGYKTSAIYIVKPAVKSDKTEQKQLLARGKCLHTAFSADNNDASVEENMFDLCYAWAKQHNLSFRGVVYIFIRFVMLGKQTDKNFYEVWAPLENV